MIIKNGGRVWEKRNLLEFLIYKHLIESHHHVVCCQKDMNLLLD